LTARKCVAVVRHAGQVARVGEGDGVVASAVITEPLPELLAAVTPAALFELAQLAVNRVEQVSHRRELTGLDPHLGFERRHGEAE
jgi:hypothetical protein